MEEESGEYNERGIRRGLWPSQVDSSCALGQLMRVARLDSGRGILLCLIGCCGAAFSRLSLQTRLSERLQTGKNMRYSPVAGLFWLDLAGRVVGSTREQT